MGDFDELQRWVKNLEKVVDPAAIRRILDKGADAGKKAADQAASASLGGDRRFSNYRGGRALSTDERGGSGDKVEIGFEGPWKLAEKGRQTSGTIRPRNRRAVLTPGGARAYSRYGRSRGLKTHTNAVRKASTTVSRAMHEQFESELGRIL